VNSISEKKLKTLVPWFKPVVLNLFQHILPHYQTRLPDVPPIHSVVLIY